MNIVKVKKNSPNQGLQLSKIHRIVNSSSFSVIIHIIKYCTRRA